MAMTTKSSTSVNARPPFETVKVKSFFITRSSKIKQYRTVWRPLVLRDQVDFLPALKDEVFAAFKEPRACVVAACRGSVPASPHKNISGFLSSVNGFLQIRRLMSHDKAVHPQILFNLFLAIFT